MHFLYMFAFTFFSTFLCVRSLSAFNLKAVQEHLATGWLERWAKVICEHGRCDATLSRGGV